MSLRRIRYFLSVAKHLNFTKAARECYVAQAAISQQIKQYEQELGFKLFERGGISVHLTPAGEYFYHQCFNMMAQYNGAVGQARKIADGEKDSLRVGFSGPYAQQSFATQLCRFHGRYPEVGVDVQEGQKDSLLEALLQGDLDMMVILDQDIVLDNHFDVVELSSDLSKFMIGGAHPLAGRRRIAPVELTGETVIITAGGDQEDGESQVPEFYARCGLGQNKIRWVKTYFEKILMVEAGLGIAAIPAGGGPHIPEGISLFELEGNAHRLSTVAVRLLPPVSRAADSFFRMIREGEEQKIYPL